MWWSVAKQLVIYPMVKCVCSESAVLVVSTLSALSAVYVAVLLRICLFQCRSVFNVCVLMLKVMTYQRFGVYVCRWLCCQLSVNVMLVSR